MTSASKPRAAAGGGKVTSSRTGLQLDPADPEDAKIIARQRKVSREMGRQGRGRPDPDRSDLQEAYDEGAKAAADKAQQTKAPAGKGAGGKSPSAWTRYRQMGPGWGAVKPTSPTKLPTKASDAGGFLAGVAVYMVVVIYIRYGPAGWSGWLSAKFLNKPLNTGNASTSSSNGKPTSSSGGSKFI